ncbi:ankyrin repeat domain-containing protein [Arsenophonus nasoniae]|nr:ankyrin repeat domain-containing protein [Arsenophonus nasoniae]
MFIIAGKNNIAVHTLNLLKFKYKIRDLAVVINKTDNGINDWQYSLKKRAIELNIAILTLEEAEKRATVFLSLEFDKLVKIEKFKTKRLFNIHFSLLPKYKGMFTSVWPILNNDNSGVTLHYIDNGIDTGKIIDQIGFSIENNYTSKDVYLNYIDYAIQLIEKNLKDIIADNLDGYPQSVECSSYYSNKSIDFSNKNINFYHTAWEVGRYIRAFSFRNYQLPVHNNVVYCNYEITSERSAALPGTMLENNQFTSKFSTIDYDIVLYKDRLELVFQLCQQGDLEELKKYIRNISSINDRNQQSWSLLMIAAYNGYYDMVAYLIEMGADVNATNYKGTTVLMYAKEYALRSGNKKLFHYLLMLGANDKKVDMYYKFLTDYLNNTEIDFLYSNN